MAKTFGAKSFTRAEDDVIRLGLEMGAPVSGIVQRLGRSRAAVYRRIQVMRDSGEIGQGVLSLGQIEGATHDSAE